ncbi:MAG: S-adenosylmethionine decarboxylase [Gammaproteobacteria bacterium]|nr:MAG: S-adenosylmethionine decarboxylase [Gammaproteobacteria bacterium]
MIVHKHLIIRAEVEKPPVDVEFTKDWMRSLVQKIGMKICAGPISAYVDVPGNRGVTAVTIIETSHIAMHVWDEPDPALLQLDVYTCGPFDPSVIFQEIEQFVPVKISWKYLDREHDLVEIPVD